MVVWVGRWVGGLVDGWVCKQGGGGGGGLGRGGERGGGGGGGGGQQPLPPPHVYDQPLFLITQISDLLIFIGLNLKCLPFRAIN